MKDVDFECFTNLAAAFERLKAAAPGRVFFDLDAVVEYRGVRGPLNGRFVGVYEDGTYCLERFRGENGEEPRANITRSLLLSIRRFLHAPFRKGGKAKRKTESERKENRKWNR